MKFPIGILKTVVGIVVSEVVDRITGSDETPPKEVLVTEVVDKVITHISINPEALAAELIMELLTEERSDEFLDSMMKELELPFGTELTLKKALDAQLPEVIRDPLLEMLGYEFVDGILATKSRYSRKL